MSVLERSDSYFPPTPELSDGDADPFTAHKPKDITKQMASLNVKGNGAGRGISPTRSGAPTKVTLHLGHLPSKKEIKGTWPRTPSRVCFILQPDYMHICAYV